MIERAKLIEWLRSEIVGPKKAEKTDNVINFEDRVFYDTSVDRSGPIFWLPDETNEPQEVIYFKREAPSRKYGVGMLHPIILANNDLDDTLADSDLQLDDNSQNEKEKNSDEEVELEGSDPDDLDFEINSLDNRKIASIGISFSAFMPYGSILKITVPQKRSYPWQGCSEDFPVNGRYERCRMLSQRDGRQVEGECWRRRPAVNDQTIIEINVSDMTSHKVIKRVIDKKEDNPIDLQIEVFPRRMALLGEHCWLFTVVLKNITPRRVERSLTEETLFQSYFEVSTTEPGKLIRYPESVRTFSELDFEEQSLNLLYREAATWGIGHNCSAGWDCDPGQEPKFIYAEIFPAVELPSMTPDITDMNGDVITVDMRSLVELDDSGNSIGWKKLELLVNEYKNWIFLRKQDANEIDKKYSDIIRQHLDQCHKCLDRMSEGLQILKDNHFAREAFRLANLSMLLQQISTKQIKHRALKYSGDAKAIVLDGSCQNPWAIYSAAEENTKIGKWRAFQIAFLMMSINGLVDGRSDDRDIVDLIWFPTGGGKTEAYLGAAAFAMFFNRLSSAHLDLLDGTDVIMRYTLRMLTTQQFQRSASLICAMEYIRRNISHDLGEKEFSLGLWIGGSSTPIKIVEARSVLKRYANETTDNGNPFVLTECPWCRSGIGKYRGSFSGTLRRDEKEQLERQRVQGIANTPEGPRMFCTDSSCEYGSRSQDRWLPIEVIDERIYLRAPSMVIATADKFAMIAYRPDAGILFGYSRAVRTHRPPSLIIQDELHLISGPLGTLYSLYESIIEKLCTSFVNHVEVRPKIIASTATIRGAATQVQTLYGRKNLQLFPSPGLTMGDSFFGQYAKNNDGTLKKGRLYLGLNLHEYGSILTAQVRVFSSALFYGAQLPASSRDAWWTILAFYNSIRELGGAQTLFSSDIPARLDYLSARENISGNQRRYLNNVKELTGRLGQSEIVQLMDELSAEYVEKSSKNIDVCLASNIIEVGVDIDRLSLMAIVGQPKTTAQYIQVSGRVGRRWFERPGLVLMLYNPSKNRDISHYEQFYSYHKRLYERVEPTSATPFALPAIERGVVGALLLWARVKSNASIRDMEQFLPIIEEAYAILEGRLNSSAISASDKARALSDVKRCKEELFAKWAANPVDWEEFPPVKDKEYLMLWPGQYYTEMQYRKGIVVPTSLRQVDASGRIQITAAYILDDGEVS